MAVTRRLDPPYRAEHVGSLLRPRALKDAFRDSAAGKIDARAFAAIQDRCIRDAVRMQEDVGLRVVTDGEFRRGSWFFGFVEAVDGLTVGDALFDFHDDKGGRAEFQTTYVSGKIRRARGIATGEFGFVKSVARATPKVTMPAPSVTHFFRAHDAFDRKAYASEEAMWDDLIGVYREEVAALAAMGCTYLQLDEVPIAMIGSEAVRAKLAAAGLAPEKLLDRYIRAINAAIADRPSSMVVGAHLCQGNYKGRWMSEGGYDWVAERLFNETMVDAFFLEYDSARAGTFAPLRFLPAGKVAVLGLVSSKTPVLEPKDRLKRRIEEAARHVPLERLALSPQCGFASSVAGNPVSEDDQRRKLALVVETAREIWGTS